MHIVDGTLVAFPNGDLGVVTGSPLNDYEFDARNDPQNVKLVCEVRVLLPRGVTKHRTDVEVSTLTAIGQTKGVNALSAEAVERLVADKEQNLIDSIDPVI